MSTDNKIKRILIFGGVTITPKNGKWYTQSQIYDYISGFGEEYDEVHFFSMKHPVPRDYTTEISDPKVKVYPIYGKKNLLSIWYKALKLSKNSDCLIFFPLGVLMFPILFFLKIRSHKLSCYIANDFNAYNAFFIKRVIFKSIHRWTLRLSDFVIARGHYLTKSSGHYNKKVHTTLPIGNFKLDGFSPSEPTKKNILFVGKLEINKGPQVLVRAFANVINESVSENIHLTLVGDGPLRNELEQYIAEKNISNSVTFLGYLDSAAEMNEAFQEASVLIMSSIFPEGVPRVIDEAIVRKIPVIATTVGGVADEFSNGEVLLIAGNSVDEMTAALKELLFSKKTRDTMLKSAEKRIDFLKSFKSASEQHCSFYRKPR